MKKREFFPSLFFDALSEELSLNDISNKLKCSVTTSEKNLQELIDDKVVSKKWKYGMWMYRRLTNKETSNLRWRAANPEIVKIMNRESMAKQRAKDPEKARKRGRDWARANPEKTKKSCNKWREKNREYDLQKKREWHQKNKAAQAAHQKAQRARKWLQENA